MTSMEVETQENVSSEQAPVPIEPAPVQNEPATVSIEPVTRSIDPPTLPLGAVVPAIMTPGAMRPNTDLVTATRSAGLGEMILVPPAAYRTSAQWAAFNEFEFLNAMGVIVEMGRDPNISRHPDFSVRAGYALQRFGHDLRRSAYTNLYEAANRFLHLIIKMYTAEREAYIDDIHVIEKGPMGVFPDTYEAYVASRREPLEGHMNSLE